MGEHSVGSIRLVCALALVTLVSLAQVHRSDAATYTPIAPADAIASVNMLRASAGLPADVVERPDWSAKCTLHNRYMFLNNLIQHPENVGDNGYSEDGNWAGTHSVLSWGEWSGAPSPRNNPWLNAPIHLMQLLGLGLKEAGASGEWERGCMTTWPGYTREESPTPVAYSLPADGAKEVDPSMIARESPFVPGDFVGLPEGTETGPHIYVLTGGPGMAAPSFTNVSIVGPDGPIDTRVVDKRTGGFDGVGDYLPAGGMLIPARPLKKASWYTVHTTLVSDDASLDRTWSFKTVLNFPGSWYSISGYKVKFATESDAPLHATIQRNGAEFSLDRTVANNETFILPGGGRYRVCLLQAETESFYGESRCKTALVNSADKVRIENPRRSRGKVSFRIKADRGYVGRKATIVATVTTRVCPSKRQWCKKKRTVRRLRSAIKRSQTLTFNALRGKEIELRLGVTIAAFTKDGVPYAAVRAHKSLKR